MNLSVAGLSLNRNGRSILKDASAVFDVGYIHILVGKNGAGKSSLLQAFAGLLPYRGALLWAGQNLAALTHRQRALLLAYLPQNIETPFALSVQDYVVMGRFPQLASWGSYTAADFALVSATLEKLGMASFASRNVQEVSGGELQKIAFARLLTQQTPVLLLDEPTAALDPKQTRKLSEELQGLKAEKLILCATHDPFLCTQPDTRLWALQAGSLKLLGAGSNLAYEEWVGEVY